MIVTVLVSMVLVLVLSASVFAAPESLVISQLTTNSHTDENPQVSGDRVVWGRYEGTNDEIFTWTPAEGTVQLTADGYDDEYPQISGNRVVWQGFDGADAEIFTWTPAGGTVQLTTPNGPDDEYPKVSGDRIVWQRYDGNPEIFTWTPAGGTVQLTANGDEDAGQDVSGDRVVWMGHDGADYEIYTAVPTSDGTPTVTLSDIASSPYKAAIEALAGAGIISGYDNGTFGPNNLVMRKHFAKMIVGVMDLPVSEDDWKDSSRPFIDCGEDDLTDTYPHDYVAVAKAHGLTLGVTAATFAPDASITRAQMVTMVVRAAQNSGIILTPVGADYAGLFRSHNNATHGPNVKLAENNGLLQGLAVSGSASSWIDAKATRGEVAQILYNLLQTEQEPAKPADMRFPVVVDGRDGFIDGNGELIFLAQPGWETGWPFSGGLASVLVGGKYGFIDKAGRMAISPQFDYPSFFDEGLAPVTLGGKEGYVDTAGRLVIQARFDYAGWFSDGLALVGWDGKAGYIDKSGQLVISLAVSPFHKFSEDNSFSEGLAVLHTEDKLGYIDKTGSVAIPAVFDFAGRFSQGLAGVEVEGFRGFIDKSGTRVITLDLDSSSRADAPASEFSDGLALVQGGESHGFKYGYVDRQGRLAVPFQFQAADPFRDGLAAVRLTETAKFGFIDTTGQMVIAPQFDEVILGFAYTDDMHGLAKVRIAEAEMYIDKQGRVVWNEN